MCEQGLRLLNTETEFVVLLALCDLNSSSKRLLSTLIISASLLLTHMTQSTTLCVRAKE